MNGGGINPWLENTTLVKRQQNRTMKQTQLLFSKQAYGCQMSEARIARGIHSDKFQAIHKPSHHQARLFQTLFNWILLYSDFPLSQTLVCYFYMHENAFSNFTVRMGSGQKGLEKSAFNKKMLVVMCPLCVCVCVCVYIYLCILSCHPSMIYY